MWILDWKRDVWRHSSDPSLTLTLFDIFDSPHRDFLLAWLRKQAR